MYRFNGFTEKANSALNLAITSAQELGHDYIGSEHLLLGLLKEGTGVAGTVLNKLGVTAEDFEKMIREKIGSGSPTVLNADDFTPRTKRILQVAAMAGTLLIMALGIGGGIERANKVMMPLFFCLFVGLAIYIATLPGAADGYRYIFVLKPEGLLDPMVWVYALGQAFFSLSVAGNGTLIYGSYLSKEADVPESARTVAFFDSMAAILSALVIIPAMATAGETLTQSGPGLMFIYLPNLFREMPGGRILMAVFFVAALFAGVTSLVNLFEAPTATLQEKLHLSRGTAVAVIGVVGLAVGLCIQGIVSGWMDVCSIYACPIGALLAGVFFYWVLKKEDCLVQVNLARRRPLGRWFYPTAKYLYCGVTVLVLILGAVNGGIG